MADTNTMTDDQESLNETAGQRDPFDLFQEWFALARQKEPNNPNAMALSTVGQDQMPNVRMVLLKDVSKGGFVFYTNFESIKGQELLATPKAALCFYWKSLQRQVRIQGEIAEVAEAEADAYFASRPKDSQIGAWASIQSSPMEGRFEFEKRIAKFATKYALSKVDRPPHWSGFRLTPSRMEFWQEKPFRLHDRLAFERSLGGGTAWATSRLYP